MHPNDRRNCCGVHRVTRAPRALLDLVVGQTGRMKTIVVREGGAADMEAAAGLRWQWTVERSGVAAVSREDFVTAVLDFSERQSDIHHCFVATRDRVLIGMAWLAVLPRVPSPSALVRACGDVQCVYVVPEERNANVGNKLMSALLTKADQLRLEHVTVHSSVEAISLYERSGFSTSIRFLAADFAAR